MGLRRSRAVAARAVAGAVAVVACWLLQGCGSDAGADRKGTGVPAAGAGGSGSATGGGIAPQVDTVDGIPRWFHDSAAYANAPRWSLDATLIGETPGAGGDAAFDLTYSDVVRLTSDNKVVALAAIGNSLTIFSAEGKPLHRYFRTGKGPGDLMRPAGLSVLSGDTILIPDDGNQRLNWVHVDKGVVRSAPVQPLAGTEQLYLREHVGEVDGKLIGVAVRYGNPRPGDDTTGRDDMRVLLLEQSGARMNQVAQVLGAAVVPYETRYRGRVEVQRTPPRLAHQTSFALWNSRVVVGAGPGFELTIWSMTGTPVSRLVVAAPRAAVTKAMRDALMATELAQMNGPQMEQMIDPAESRRLVEARPWADTLPAYYGLFPATSDMLWVASYPLPGAKEPWSATAFGSGGQLVGRIQGRSSGVPLAFGTDRVVVREEDEDGVARLRIYRLISPR